MTNIQLVGEPPFHLPATQSARARATTDAVEITFHMVAADGKLQPVTVSLVARKAIELADEIGKAAGAITAEEQRNA